MRKNIDEAEKMFKKAEEEWKSTNIDLKNRI